MNYNRVQLIGRLTRPPEYFPAGSKGQEHATATIAVNRVVPTSEGPAADYIPISIWGPIAQHFCEHRGKGDTVMILGRIRTSLVPQADGTKRPYWEVRVEKIQYGQQTRKNSGPAPESDSVTRAVDQLNAEFGE